MYETTHLNIEHVGTDSTNILPLFSRQAKLNNKHFQKPKLTYYSSHMDADLFKLRKKNF